MTAPSVPSPRRSYSGAMLNTYITEAIQSGHHCNELSHYKFASNSTTNNITNNIHIRITDIDKHGNFYATTKGGSMTPERLLNFINLFIEHTDGAPAALFLDVNYVISIISLLFPFYLALQLGCSHVMYSYLAHLRIK